jgi:hypothetical protein
MFSNAPPKAVGQSLTWPDGGRNTQDIYCHCNRVSEHFQQHSYLYCINVILCCACASQNFFFQLTFNARSHAGAHPNARPTTICNFTEARCKTRPGVRCALPCVQSHPLPSKSLIITFLPHRPSWKLLPLLLYSSRLGPRHNPPSLHPRRPAPRRASQQPRPLDGGTAVQA